MKPQPSTQIVCFGVFELDTRSGELRRHGLKIRLPDQSFQILRLLLARPGDVVTREELRHALWTSDTFVDFDVSLNSAVRKLREALDDSAENPQFVETLPRRGYRFVASVSSHGADQTPESASPATPPAASGRRLIWITAGALLAATVTAVGLLYQRGGFVSRAGATAGPIASLAVLPFENLTGDAAQEYFVDSVTEALTTQLAQVQGLDVISRTSARQYKQPLKSLPAIGDELKVDAIVEGSVVRSGTRVRITVQLVRAATDRHIWARSYDDELSRMMSLQQLIAAEIAIAAGRAAPRSSTPRRRDVDPVAYDAYLKGLTAGGSQRYEGHRRAIGYFEQAIARQPDFAEAYAALARTQQQFLFGGPVSPREAIPKAEAAARKALHLDDTLAQAHQTLGRILSLYYWRWDEADKEYQRAAELRAGPDEPTEGITLIRQGRFAEAIAAAERARRLDPLSFNAQLNVGTAYRAAGQHDRAVAVFRRALETSPGHTRAHFQLGATFVAMGRLGPAIRELEAAVRSPAERTWRVEAYLGYAYAAAGRTVDARRVLKELEAHRLKQYVSSFGIALIHDALGEKAPALAALERAYEDRAVEFGQMTQYPPFKTIASEARFRAIMQQVGHRPLPDVSDVRSVRR